MFFWGSILNVLAFMRTQHLDFFDTTISFLDSHTALLCLLVRRACMWCWFHFRSTCSHVSRSGQLHVGRVIDGKASLPKNSCFLAFPIYWLCLSFVFSSTMNAALTWVSSFMSNSPRCWKPPFLLGEMGLSLSLYRERALGVSKLLRCVSVGT